MSPIVTLLDAAVSAGDPPAAQCCVVVEGRVAHHSAHACGAESSFDLASVTKVHHSDDAAVVEVLQNGNFVLHTEN